MLIAEDLLLLLTDDRTGKLAVPPDYVDVALGGAVLLDLQRAGRVAISGEADASRPECWLVTDRGETSDIVLDESLACLGATRGGEAKDVVCALANGLRKRLYARLVARGLLHEESTKVLGIFPTHRWPASDAVRVNSVRSLLVDALRVGATDDTRAGALISLLQALKAVRRVVDPTEAGVPKKIIDANAKQISERSWISKPVREAIDEITAIAAAAAASTTAVSRS